MLFWDDNIMHSIVTIFLFCFGNCSIGDRRDAVVSRRQKVKELSSERAAKLQASLAWQQFNRDADEVCIMELDLLYVTTY